MYKIFFTLKHITPSKLHSLNHNLIHNLRETEVLFYFISFLINVSQDFFSLYNYTVNTVRAIYRARIEVYNIYKPSSEIIPPAPAIIFYRSDNWFVINIKYSSHIFTH